MNPPHQVDKQLVCRQFRRAAGSYDRQASVQLRTADHLLDLLLQHGGKPPRRVLEIGCCTGMLTRMLLERMTSIKELTLNDLVPDFASRMDIPSSGPKIALLPGDIESIPLPCSFDLVVSSSTFHWLHSLEGLLVKLASCLTSGGILAFSMYGPDNLQEIRSIAGIGLSYPSLSHVEAVVGRHFRLSHGSEQKEVLHFAAPQEVLRHLRQTGVNALGSPPWNRSRLAHFCREYLRLFSVGQQVRLTYHPLFFVAQQK